MNNLETQLRHYAVAVAGPAHHDHAEPHEDLTPTRGRRAGFAVAAGVLVALAVAAGVVVATRSHQTTAASATTEANGLQVRLDVNTTTPGPTDQVTAKMTATNVSAEPIATRTLCPSNVTIEPAATPGPPVAASPPLSPPEALAQWFNPMIQGAILHGVGDAGTPSDPPCNREQTTLNPGAHLSVVATVTPGTLGLDPVPMHIVARYWPMGTVNPAWLPFTVPSPPGKASRSSAWWWAASTGACRSPT